MKYFCFDSSPIFSSASARAASALTALLAGEAGGGAVVRPGFGDGSYVGLYEVAGAKSAIRGSGKIEHTDDFRWLDKGALRLDQEGDEDPWQLCTVT
ncbi:hypothetical protein ZWY2020_015834 [Hordeum vulgare]|nr:hypothetical protein ZWY2020_015834 [Hordeum vulgare]